MADKSNEKDQKEKKEQPDMLEIYGQQGNQGQYGQGQYDSEGKPDPHGLQAQQIGLDPKELKPKPEDEKEQTTRKKGKEGQ